MTLPARRHKNSGKVNLGRRITSHLQWIRGHVCALDKSRVSSCYGPIECAHVEGSGTGGMGMKADDIFTIPLCQLHHRGRHSIGWQTFDRLHHFDALALARDLARKSPHIQRAARERGHDVEQETEA